MGQYRPLRGGSVWCVLGGSVSALFTDDRINGVGYEISMISYEVYKQDVNKRKFIPVLRKGSAEENTPTFLSSKASVNMRAEEENSFQELVKAIHGYSDKPVPKSIPNFLKEKIEPETLSTPVSFSQSRRITTSNDPLLRKDPHFLGRDTLIQDIAAQLADPDCFALTIIGEPGIGKTDLCKAVLRKRLSDDPTSKVFYLKIEDFDTTDGVRYVMAEALGYSSHLQEKELFIEIAQHPGLYYFDNLESAAVDPTLPVFLEKLSEIPGFQALASSRQAVSGWDTTVKLNELADADACLLFQKIWREKGGSITEEEKPLFEAFVKNELGNHPLSITLTAPQGASYTGIKELIAEWSKIGTAIAKDSRIGPDNRHRNLQVSLSLSVKTIADQKGAIHLWSLVALFPEGMPPEDQAWFLERKTFNREDRASLVNKNILRNIDGYLTLLPPVARYAEDMLRENKFSFLRARFFDVAYPWFSELVDNAEKARKGEPVWKLIRHFPAMRRFMVFFAGTNTQRQNILKLHDKLSPYYDRNLFLGLEILEKLLSQYRKTLSPTDRGKLHFYIGDLYRLLSQSLHSRNHLEQAIKCFNNPIVKLGKASVFIELGELEKMTGNDESAKYWFNKALILYEQEKNNSGKANVLISVCLFSQCRA